VSEPTKGPFKVNQCGSWWYIDGADDVALAELVIPTSEGGDKLAHLLAASWEMREALEAVHDWRGLCDANDMETFERIGEMFRKDTGYLRPGKDDARYTTEQRLTAWNDWTKKKNDELDARIRAALAKAQGERHEG